MFRARVWALVLAAVFAIGISDSLLRMSVQPTDSLELILQAQLAPSALSAFTSSIAAHGYMRPMYRAQNKILLDLSKYASPWLAYRGFHAFLLSACLLLFVASADVRTTEDFAAFAFAILTLIGIHTFRGAVQEAYPVNHYLNVTVVCVLVLVIARSRGGWWADGLAAAAFAYGILVLETGALAWVIAVTAWAVGWRGISVRGLAAMTALLAIYLYVRFFYFPVGVPQLDERSTGFLLSVLDPRDLIQRFGQHPTVLYVYNIAASIVSVLFSEPRAGRFVAVKAWLEGTLHPYMIIALFTSTVTTAGLVVASVQCWRRRTLDDNARFLILFVLVLLGNAALSFAYTKDEILIPAGVFYALAAYAACRMFLTRARQHSRAVTVVAAVLLAVLSLGWAVRAANVSYVMRSKAFKHRGDWAELPGEWRRDGRWPTNPAAERLLVELRNAALALPAPNPRFEPRWLQRVLEE